MTTSAGAHLINPAIVICHDILYDGPATVEATRRFLAEAADLAEPGRFTYLAVPQGSTRREWLDCHARLADLPGVDMIGLMSVPRCFAGPVAEARLDCLAALTTAGNPPLPMHLLGGNRSLIWELCQHHTRGYDVFIAGNDSSFAFWYAAYDLAADARAGRAQRQAPDKPNLHDHVIDPARLAAAHRHVALLRDAAGLPPLPAAAARRLRRHPPPRHDTGRRHADRDAVLGRAVATQARSRDPIQVRQGMYQPSPARPR